MEYVLFEKSTIQLASVVLAQTHPNIWYHSLYIHHINYIVYM